MNKAKSEGRFFYILTFRPPLAFICSWVKSLTPRCFSTALCQAQGPISVSSLILGVDPLLMVQPVEVAFTFSLFPNTQTISVWHCSSFSHLQVTVPQALCHPSSLGSERSPHPLLTVSLMLPRFIDCRHQQKLAPFFMGYFESFLVPLFLGLIVFLFFPAWL